MKRLVVALFLIVLPFQLWAMHPEHNKLLGTNSPSLASLHYPNVVTAIFQDNHDHLIWQSEVLKDRFQNQLELIDSAGFSPLFSDRLHQLHRLRQQNDSYEYELVATDTLIAYISYAELATESGKVWFFEQGLNTELPEPTNEALVLLFSAVELQDIGQLIDVYTPKSASYQHLVRTYFRFKEHQDDDFQIYKQNGLAKSGDKLDQRELLITRLQMLSVDVSEVRDDVSWYDNSLVEAVKTFQNIHGLKPDGIIGPLTVAWLNVAPSERIEILALNAERSRMWPTQKDSLIVVNVPSFSMKYWNLGHEVFESKVVVGRTERKTPLLNIKMDALIFNPSWNVPRKIMVEDILPKAINDTNYLNANHIEIIPRWNAKTTISPSEINWETLNPKIFPYKMRQQSGTTNALGLYKFNTPNPRAIYLHDTPSKYLFNKNVRAFSSGCVRVEEADRLASVLIKTQGIQSRVESVDISTPNRAVPLRRRIPVHIIYQTAWSEDGIVHYRDDIYRYDRFSHPKNETYKFTKS